MRLSTLLDAGPEDQTLLSIVAAAWSKPSLYPMEEIPWSNAKSMKTLKPIIANGGTVVYTERIFCKRTGVRHCHSIGLDEKDVAKYM